MASAANRVLENYELLENIITCISNPRDIFVIQRVCRTWQALIQRSKEIQRLMFGHSKQLPLPPRGYNGIGWTIVYNQTLQINRLWQNPKPIGGMPFTIAFGDRPDSQGKSSSFSFAFDWKPPIYMRGGSYRGLPVTEPLCTKILIQFEERPVIRSISLVVHDSDGITLGTFEDIALNVATCGGMRAPQPVVAYVVLSVLEPSEEQI